MLGARVSVGDGEVDTFRPVVDLGVVRVMRAHFTGTMGIRRGFDLLQKSLCLKEALFFMPIRGVSATQGPCECFVEICRADRDRYPPDSLNDGT